MLKTEIQDKKIYITDAVIEVLKIQQLGSKENGGILLGQVSNDEERVLVCRVSLTGVNDTRRIFSFRRDKSLAQNIIKYEFHNSGGKNIYLGEWHSHSSNKARPSSQDIHMIERQFDTNEMNVDFILLFIVADLELFVGIYDGRDLYSKIFNRFEIKIRAD